MEFWKMSRTKCVFFLSILALEIFLFKILFKSGSKSFFFSLASRTGFGPAIPVAVAHSSLVFCNSVFADYIVIAVSRLLRAVAACVMPLSFAAGLRASYWSGCMKVAKLCVSRFFSILAILIFLLKILPKTASHCIFCFGVEIQFWTCNFRPRCT